MASDIIPFAPPAPQPGLRAWIIYNQLPDGCIAFEAKDRTNEPHVHKGEFLVIDPNDRDPVHGEMYVIEWLNGDHDIVEAGLQAGRYGVGPNETMVDTSLWFAY